ncbi:MAG: AIR carboxylase family protein [Planctomycetes bacterium]|nr:AIR carboxylase family protein [Planctomycetota bacterium]
MIRRIIILMGSKSDLSFAQEIGKALAEFGLEAEYRIASAHKSAAYLLKILADYEMLDCSRVYITVAGRSNALSGMVDANVTAPVISCPPYSDRFAGADLFSSLRMPSGVAPLTVLEPGAAALAAAKILALEDPAVRERVAAFQEAQRQRILTDDQEIV